MKKDYYDILGVAKDASVQQIKKAYRSKALKYHPDRVPENQKKESEEKFKEISEAYGVLSDPQKRQMYDQYGHAGIDQRYTAEDIFRQADFGSIFGEGGIGDIFSQFFGDSVFDFGGGGHGGQRRRRGRDIQYEVEISLEEAFSGVRKKIRLPRHEHCSQCDGSGAKDASSMKTCSTCQGRGQVFVSSGFFRMAQTCSTCRGRGQMISEFCPKCQGQGVVRVTRNIDVNIPAGVSNDTQMRVRGEGEVGSGGSGDLYLYIRVKPHKVFKREGNDLHMDLPVNFAVAALGGEMPVQTMDGTVTMKIPAGTQSGKVFRLKGKGVPDVHGREPGDQYVKIMLSVPVHLTSEQRKILEEFARISDLQVHHHPGEKLREKFKKVFK